MLLLSSVRPMVEVCSNLRRVQIRVRPVQTFKRKRLTYVGPAGGLQGKPPGVDYLIITIIHISGDE